MTESAGESVTQVGSFFSAARHDSASGSARIGTYVKNETVGKGKLAP